MNDAVWILFRCCPPHLPGSYCCLHAPNPWSGGEPHWRNIRFHTQCVIMTWRYLFSMSERAIPRVQREYWDLLIANGIVPE